jgi:hypothetical protein
MPKVGSDRRRSEGEVLWRAQRVQVPGAVTAEHHRACLQILDGKAVRVKFNIYVIITSKLTNENKVFNHRWRNKNIIKLN